MVRKAAATAIRETTAAPTREASAAALGPAAAGLVVELVPVAGALHLPPGHGVVLAVSLRVHGVGLRRSDGRWRSPSARGLPLEERVMRAGVGEGAGAAPDTSGLGAGAPGGAGASEARARGGCLVGRREVEVVRHRHGDRLLVRRPLGHVGHF